MMTTNSRKSGANGPRGYTVRNIYRNYVSDEEKALNLARLKNGVIRIVSVKQQGETINPIGKFK